MKLGLRVSARLANTLLTLADPLIGNTRRFAIWRTRLLVDSGEPERAILFAHRHLAQHPGAAWLHFHAGRAAQSKGLPKQARVRFAHAATLEGSEATFRFALGYVLRQQGELAAAAREYRRALHAVPGEPHVLFNLGVVERERRELEAAQVCFEQALHQWPKDVRLHYTLGVCAFERHDHERATLALDRAISLDKRHHKAHYQRALIDLERGNRDLAYARLQHTLKLQPSYGPAHYAMGRALVSTDPIRARQHYRESILAQPPMLRAHFDLGRLYEKVGRLKEARREYMLYQRHFPQKRATWIEQRLARLDERIGTQ